MKISPVPSSANIAPAPIDQSSGSAVQNYRSIRMQTNATPQEYDFQGSQPGQLPISAPNETGQAGVAEETQPISPQFAALARQRRALQVKERALADRERALQGQSGQTDSIALARLKSEPLNVLLENGVTYDQLTEAILANQANPQMTALEQKMKSLEEGMERKLQEREQAAEKQALAQMRKDAEQLISEGTEFELVRATQSVPDVMKLIERTYRQTGEVLDVTEACKLIEDELFKDAQRVIGLEKVRSQFMPQAPQMQRHQGMRTLTNRDTASVPMTPKARAMAAFYGTLKK